MIKLIQKYHLAPALVVKPFFMYSACSKLITIDSPMFGPGREDFLFPPSVSAVDRLELKVKQFP